MENFYNLRDKNFGVRNNREGLKDFMDLESDSRKLDKFMVELNHDKLKAMQ